MSKKLKMSDELYAKLKGMAEVAGYSSADEFALHILETTAAEVDESASEEEVRKRLKGLGYLG